MEVLELQTQSKADKKPPRVTPHVCEFSPVPGVYALPQVINRGSETGYSGKIFKVQIVTCECGQVKLIDAKPAT